LIGSERGTDDEPDSLRRGRLGHGGQIGYQDPPEPETGSRDRKGQGREIDEVVRFITLWKRGGSCPQYGKVGIVLREDGGQKVEEAPRFGEDLPPNLVGQAGNRVSSSCAVRSKSGWTFASSPFASVSLVPFPPGSDVPPCLRRSGEGDERKAMEIKGYREDRGYGRFSQNTNDSTSSIEPTAWKRIPFLT
jgi:hypothetical protein